jgi:hypothetical protein
MPTSGIVPIPCDDVAEGMVQLPADSKHPSKLSGARARRAAQRKVLEHVSLGHGSCVVQRKSPPLVGFTSLQNQLRRLVGPLVSRCKLFL